MSGGTRSYEMARRLVAKGHEVHMITSWRDGGDGNDWFLTEEAGIQVHWLPIAYSNHMNFGQRIKAFLRFALASSRKAASIKADLIFATSTPLTIAIPGVYASKRQRIPMVFEVRDLWPEIPIAMGALKNPILRFTAQRLERWAYRNARAVVALSPGMKAGVVRAGYPRGQIAVIPNSSDIDIFSDVDGGLIDHVRCERGWLGDGPLLIYTGTFGLINGVGYMVNLAQHLLDIAPEIRILLVGDGVEYQKVLADADNAGVLNRNLFIEQQVPKRDIPALLSIADMASSLVIDKPEMRANSANKFFDSLAAGKPIMINYGGWQADLLESNDAGVVTWQMDIKEAAEMLAKTLGDKDWLAKAGVSSRRLAEQLFSRDQLASQLEEVLVRAVEGNQWMVSEIAPGEYALANVDETK
ncbi:Glycosyltransferase involved in cell wall bisynthesis [Modicisalibacter muralis]|uniref:Glycosyltransferase involved in cell wall bisynthesis n=1 Tax=Modicisalibacter muralis TaxID=119000 RepID=A0A1G9LZ65_9GAMM|nr:glycosyltransferase family 4 protein [Halomonas muralis]SDL67320.1 Glycosyltransferase involved in cell wall bisynthesis [Halomonas muralis]